MTQAKYFQKLECEICHGSSKLCYDCKGSGIIAGADITSTIKPILEWIENSKDEYKPKVIDKGIYNLVRSGFNNGLQKAKQIIEENIIIEK